MYAIKGTAGITDLLADAGDIVLDGLALYQVVDMYNDWSRIKAGVGNTYQAAKFVTLTTETVLLNAERVLLPFGVKGLYELSLLSRGDVVIDNPSGLVQTIAFASSTQVFSDARAYGNFNLPPGATLTTTGHSLGGHLAVAFTRLFPSEGADAVTVNGAGFPTGLVQGLSGNAGTDARRIFGKLGNGGNNGQLLWKEAA